MGSQKVPWGRIWTGRPNERRAAQYRSIGLYPSIGIATTFFRAGLIEAWGRGTIKIIEECKKFNLPTPVFTNEFSGLQVTFRGKKSSEKSSEKILKLIKENGFITIADLAKDVGISTRGIEKQLAKLKEAKTIKRIGANRGGYWEVNT